MFRLAVGLQAAALLAGSLPGRTGGPVILVCGGGVAAIGCAFASNFDGVRTDWEDDARGFWRRVGYKREIASWPMRAWSWIMIIIGLVIMGVGVAFTLFGRPS